jgi:hypothetical protein
MPRTPLFFLSVDALPQSPELEAILAPIRLAQEQADYASLLAGPSLHQSRAKDTFDLRNSTDHWDFKTASHPQLSVKQEWNAVKRELSAVANVLASMAAVATAVWWAAGNIDLSTVRSDPFAGYS